MRPLASGVGGEELAAGQLVDALRVPRSWCLLGVAVAHASVLAAGRSSAGSLRASVLAAGDPERAGPGGRRAILRAVSVPPIALTAYLDDELAFEAFKHPVETPFGRRHSAESHPASATVALRQEPEPHAALRRTESETEQTAGIRRILAAVYITRREHASAIRLSVGMELWSGQFVHETARRHFRIARSRLPHGAFAKNCGETWVPHSITCLEPHPLR